MKLKKLSETIIQNFKKMVLFYQNLMFFLTQIILLRDQEKNLEVQCLHLIEKMEKRCV